MESRFSFRPKFSPKIPSNGQVNVFSVEEIETSVPLAFEKLDYRVIKVKYKGSEHALVKINAKISQSWAAIVAKDFPIEVNLMVTLSQKFDQFE